MNRETLKQLVSYDPLIGMMTWLERPRKFFKSDCSCKTWNTRYAGNVITNSNVYNGKSYKRIRIFGKDYLQHRIIFMLLTGKSPLEVDHIDGDSMNNKLNNLREVDRKTNCKNARLPKDNKSGVSGINWDNWSNKWLVRIAIEGKGTNLGRFSDFFEACCIRKSAEIKHGYHMNHGKRYRDGVTTNDLEVNFF